MPSIAGDLELMPLADVVAWIGNRGQSVTLTAKRRGTNTEFVIRDGKVRYTASSDPREFLGQHLINFGYINEEQLGKAFETQRETHVPLGKVLVMVDSLTTEQLNRVLVFKARESLLEALCWTEGHFRVTSDVAVDKDLDFAIPIDLLEAHSEGEARARMWQEIRRVFPSDGTRCDVLSEPADLSTFDKRILTELRAGKSIGEASLELRSMDFQTYARLYDLHNRKVVEPRLESVEVEAPVLDLNDEVPNAEVQVDDSDVVEEGFDSSYSVIRPVTPKEAPGVVVPAEASNPSDALRIALAGRNFKEALLLADRILEVDPQNAEAIAARRVAEAQVRKNPAAGGEDGLDLQRTPTLTVPRAQLATGHLTSKERYVLSRIDGKRTLHEIAQVSPIQREELVRIVEAFLQRKVVTLQ